MCKLQDSKYLLLMSGLVMSEHTVLIYVEVVMTFSKPLLYKQRQEAAGKRCCAFHMVGTSSVKGCLYEKAAWLFEVVLGNDSGWGKGGILNAFLQIV